MSVAFIVNLTNKQREPYAISTLRVRNQYLLSILSLVTQLGALNVSSSVLVEAWKEKGRPCDDNFFMHFEVLHRYQFLTQAAHSDQLLNMEQLLDFTTEQDKFVSITHAGREFLHRFGGV